MRGARSTGRGLAGFLRIIPADAGSTWVIADKADRKEDHPRGCGEHMFTLETEDSGTGSSPQMRGAPYSAM